MTDKWADLKVRAASALVLIVVGVVAVYLGGVVFALLVTLLTATMVWELAGLTAPQGPTGMALAVLAAFCLWFSRSFGTIGLLLLVLPALGFWLTPRRDAGLLAVYALALMIAGAGFLNLRMHGVWVFVWLVAVVVATDTMGYFAGRMLGGPKFWPKISPKKTWSGTVAGWIGAGVVGVVFASLDLVPWSYAVLSPLIALAGQMGDIVESWIKRRAGAKDSSRLIPGHGGVLDRFDALVGAVLALQALGLLMAGPV